jgi:predicted component of type VI protein secretion system
MKITTTLLSDEARPADVRHLAAPGITLGRCSDNDIPLCGGQKPVGRVQAVIRSDGEYWLLESLSKISAVWLNGRPLAPRQTAALASGDRIRIGDHEVCVEEERWAERAEAEESDESPSPAEETDIFQDLLGGPGVLPVGSNMPVETLHPFDMQSSTLRNHPDPLALLPEEREILPPVIRRQPRWTCASHWPRIAAMTSEKHWQPAGKPSPLSRHPQKQTQKHPHPPIAIWQLAAGLAACHSELHD